MTLTDTEVDLETIAELNEAVPCEVEFVHEAIGSDQPAKYILRVQPQCSGVPCEINEIGVVTVLICEPCVQFANAVGWTLNHGEGHIVRYHVIMLEPIDKKAD